MASAGISNPVRLSAVHTGFPLMNGVLEEADMKVKLSLSFFSLAKIIELAKKVTKKTLESILSLG